MLATRVISTPLGRMTAAATERGLCALEFEGQRTDRAMRALSSLGEAGDDCVPGPASMTLDAVEREMAAYFAGELKKFTLPLDLDPCGTASAFEMRVWLALRKIPFGQTRSYGDLAMELGRPGASRAVGMANGRNRIAIVTPCHRVIGSDGRLTGYAGGLERKRRLLEIEGSWRPNPSLFESVYGIGV